MIFLLLFLCLIDTDGFLVPTPKLKIFHKVSVRQDNPTIFQLSKTVQTRSQHCLVPPVFLFGRLFKMISSHVNAFIRKFEDPEKMLEQTISDMQKDLLRIRHAYSEIYAGQKRLERSKTAADSLCDDWHRRALLAVQKGDDKLAREALKQRKLQSDLADSFSKQLELHSAAAEKLNSSMKMLEEKIAEAKVQKDHFILRAKTAKTTLEVTNMLASVSGKAMEDNSIESFERMKSKVESLEFQAESMAHLTNQASLGEEFQKLDNQSDVENELSQLKSFVWNGYQPIDALKFK